MISSITSPRAPAPLGHYVQGAFYRDLLFISGQLAIRPDGTHTVGASFEDQAKLALKNVLSIVDAAGATPEGILKVTAYIVDVENWPMFNRVYQEMLGRARPARSVVPVPALHHGYLIEIDAVAVRQTPAIPPE